MAILGPTLADDVGLMGLSTGSVVGSSYMYIYGPCLGPILRLEFRICLSFFWACGWGSLNGWKWADFGVCFQYMLGPLLAYSMPIFKDSLGPIGCLL